MFSMMKTSLSIVLDSLEDANNHGIASKDEMEPGEKEALIEVLQQLKSVSSHSMQLKRKLAETGHVKSKVRRKGTGPGEAEPKLQNESYTTSTLEYDLPFDFLQFVHQICGQGIPFPLDHALKCAVAGFTPVEDFSDVITKYAEADHSGKLYALVTKAVEAGHGLDRFKNLYSVGKDPSLLGDNGVYPWIVHVCDMMIRISTGLSWNALKTNEEKKQARNSLYKPGEEVEDKEYETETYKKWLGQFEATRTACTRALEAFEILGSIVILHPGFAFSKFKHTRLAPKLMVTIRDMRGKIPGADKKEQVHLELTQQLLGIWAGGEDDENDLLALLSHVEANRP